MHKTFLTLFCRMSMTLFSVFTSACCLIFSVAQTYRPKSNLLLTLSSQFFLTFWKAFLNSLLSAFFPGPWSVNGELNERIPLSFPNIFVRIVLYERSLLRSLPYWLSLSLCIVHLLLQMSAFLIILFRIINLLWWYI